MRFKTVYEALMFLQNCVYFAVPIYFQDEITYVNKFAECTDIIPVKVNPETEEIEDDDLLNTKEYVFIDCGCYILDMKKFSHDYRFDVGADSVDMALVMLATMIHRKYPYLITETISSKEITRLLTMMNDEINQFDEVDNGD